MGNQKSYKQLSKFLSYILGRRPDEFGLVPDDNGFVKIKELIKAVNEEDGWRHVRRGLVDELTVVLPDSPIEIAGGLIRAKSVKHLYKIKPAQDMPKLLFTCVTGGRSSARTPTSISTTRPSTWSWWAWCGVISGNRPRQRDGMPALVLLSEFLEDIRDAGSIHLGSARQG